MSANLDLVRSIYADWERGDFSRADWADPEIEYTAQEFGPLSAQTWTGLAGMAEGARSIIEVIEDQHIEAEEYRELDDMRVLVLDRRSGTWKQSGIGFGKSTALPAMGAHLFHVSNGKVRRLVAYFDRDRALADLGLEDSAVSQESGTPTPVELMRRGYEALNRRDFDAFVSFYAPDAVVEARTVAERFEGRAAIRGFIEEFWSAFEQYQARPDEILDLGHGVVFVTNRVTARLPESDAELQMRDGQVYEWEEGMVVRAILDLDVDAARAAAERLAKERG